MHRLSCFYTHTLMLRFSYRFSQIIGSILTGVFLDSKFRRKVRTYVGWTWLLVLTVRTIRHPKLAPYRTDIPSRWHQFAVFGGNYVLQRRYTRESIASPSHTPLNINTGEYAGLAILYAFNGILDAAWQTYACELIPTL